ncbi:MAG TPA: glycoside hydrolase family 44 protein [Rhodoblastus sp.]|nr:glycoside hydrolase family 44 protein [Rhodoblastus sp.]
MKGGHISRRALIAGLCGGGVAAGGLSLIAARSRAAANAQIATVRIDDRATGSPIDPFVYGSNEIGTMDGGAASVEYDLAAGVTVRRLGGNLMTAYNWRNNAANSGKDYEHANSAALLGFLGAAREEWGRPGELIEVFLANSKLIGARSLLTLPLAGFVAADFNGAVAANEAAPSPRFVAVDWSSDENRARGVNIPALLRRLVAQYGGAAAGGVRGYYLDNEPGLWAENHPRIVRSPPTIKSLIDRSLQAAAAIKQVDPDAWVLGPASWGAPEMLDFQHAPDWADYKAHGTFLGAYLAAFRQASERSGKRLLDMLDVHYYPKDRRGEIFRNENPKLAAAALDAPRSLDDPAYCEDSWVGDLLGCDARAPLSLPLLPSLRRLVAEKFPGVGLSIGEYNFGGPGLLSSGLAVADALGRFGRSGVNVAAHWGALDGWVGEAFRLYRMKDSGGRPFGAQGLPVDSDAGPALSLFAARRDDGLIDLAAINRSGQPIAFDLRFASGRVAKLRETLGFDQSRPQCRFLAETGADAVSRLVAPEYSARRYGLG